jgi:hypothetical protein
LIRFMRVDRAMVECYAWIAFLSEVFRCYCIVRWWNSDVCPCLAVFFFFGDLLFFPQDLAAFVPCKEVLLLKYMYVLLYVLLFLMISFVPLSRMRKIWQSFDLNSGNFILWRLFCWKDDFLVLRRLVFEWEAAVLPFGFVSPCRRSIISICCWNSEEAV